MCVRALACECVCISGVCVHFCFALYLSCVMFVLSDFAIFLFEEFKKY